MLDIYFIGNVTRISPEAPVPIFVKKEEKSVLGGAANVAANLSAANQRVSVLGICGKDENGDLLFQKLSERSIDASLVIRNSKGTITKTRFIANNNQQIMRMDVENVEEINSSECDFLLETLKKNIMEFDIIVISDYLKGLMSFEFTQGIIQIANKNRIPVIIDVKGSEPQKYKGAYLLKPNRKELHDLTKLDVSNIDAVINASRKLLTDSGCEYVLTTCGSMGMVLVNNKDTFFELSTAKEVYDVTGAGDTVLSYLAACLANKMDIKEAVSIANKASGIQVAKLGTSTVSLGEIEAIPKVITINEISEIKEQIRNKKIVFTNGCFDILHIGHIKYLQQAAALGDVLIVGLNSDESVHRLKGADRPINTQWERAEMLCVLDFINYVVIFEEDTPYQLIKTIRPDVLVKGGDYNLEDIVGKDIVEAKGGVVKVLPYIEGKSTTGMINKIKKDRCGE